MATARSAKFWDRIAARYSRQPIADEAAYRRKLEVTRGYFRPETEVLELGCGTGSTAILHAPYVKHIRAIDVSPKMLEIARGRAEEADVSNVTFECTSIDELQAPDGGYDVVLGLSILHLLEDREAVMARVYTMLKPGGVFVTSTACIADMTRLFKVIAPIGQWLGLMPLVRVFTVDQLVDSLNGAGFEIDHRWHPGKWKAVFIVARKPG